MTERQKTEVLGLLIGEWAKQRDAHGMGSIEERVADDAVRAFVRLLGMWRKQAEPGYSHFAGTEEAA